jgi:hypothetical protein
MYLCVNKSTGRIKTRGTLTDWNYQCHSFTAFKLCVIKAFNNVTFVISKTTKAKPQYIVVGLYHIFCDSVDVSLSKNFELKVALTLQHITR